MKGLLERASLNFSATKVDSVESADSDTAELGRNTSDSNYGSSQMNDCYPELNGDKSDPDNKESASDSDDDSQVGTYKKEKELG